MPKIKKTISPKGDTDFEKNLKKLILKGKKKGFLTQTEILEVFPNAEEDI